MWVSSAQSRARGLTAREREILVLVMGGYRNREIAEILWITPATVRKHLENVFAKLGVHTRTAAVARFLGVLADDDAVDGQNRKAPQVRGFPSAGL